MRYVHLAVVNLLDAFEDVGYVYLVLEHCKGGELADHLAYINTEMRVARCMCVSTHPSS